MTVRPFPMGRGDRGSGRERVVVLVAAERVFDDHGAVFLLRLLPPGQFVFQIATASGAKRLAVRQVLLKGAGALPEGAFYTYPNVSGFFGRSGVKSASDLAGKLLREAHVATVPGEGFGTRDHIRVSYATSVAELDRGLERLRKFLAAL